MKLTTTNLLYLGAAGLVVYLIYKNYNKSEKNKEAEKAVESTTTNTPISGKNGNNQAVEVTANTILKRGDRNGFVTLLQRAINSKLPSPVASLNDDGIFGAKTESALSTYWGITSTSYNNFLQMPDKKNSGGVNSNTGFNLSDYINWSF